MKYLLNTLKFGLAAGMCLTSLISTVVIVEQINTWNLNLILALFVKVVFSPLWGLPLLLLYILIDDLPHRKGVLIALGLYSIYSIGIITIFVFSIASFLSVA